MRLAGKKAIVTGSSRGIGAAVALAFARQGADMVVNYSSSEGPAKDLVKQMQDMGRQAVAVKGDVAREEDCQALVNTAMNDLGGLDIIVNNAGFTRPAMLHKMTGEQWDQVLGIHLKAVWMMSKAAQPIFKAQKNGRIINVTSVAGVVGTVGQVNYSAAKGGVISLTKSIAREMAHFNVCANVISLGIVATDMTEKIRTDEKLREIYMNRILLKRFAEADDITPAFVFLASDEAKYITGQLICVDGGYGMV
ncbi:MAG: 3-oxoacyl-ACP reductase FabG [Proteobacteria bacterium]|nr:3-oxoacyl-ACP reductase FabG [Pseudomonadota bacterium]MBU4277077.1 3-oxoacyl-ACP reductase FabG [Pseudomonadota bacterium]MBU4383510.1 3-oxoacyl-ACP reductase FabG [Pseudomonadota bacterium]MBU4603535.1 3-oxoacyl-ACP reductase FabG [Pseudomonadota bacterium]MCG2764435.1 3-oxoacyl-ACP reductase FabG [Desulfarculaceae bacterium]